MALPEKNRTPISNLSAPRTAPGMASPSVANGAGPYSPTARPSPQQNNGAPDLTAHGRTRRRNTPTPVEATVYWWRTDERKASYSSNQFGIMPATPVRFRCVGSMTPKYPKRYRIELAQALDWLPELNRKELRELGAALTAAVSMTLGVEVAQFSGELIDFHPAMETA